MILNCLPRPEYATAFRSPTRQQCLAVGAHTMLHPETAEGLIRALQEAAELPGSLAELGCCKGGSALLMHCCVPRKRLHVFDTFAGLPNQDSDSKHRKGEFMATVKGICELFGQWGNRDWLNLFLYVGVFPATVSRRPNFALIGDAAQRPALWGESDKQCFPCDHFHDFAGNERFACVHIDADTYESTLAAIDWFWPRMVSGGIMVFDDAMDFPNCPGVTRAIKERFAPEQYQQMAPAQVWARKPQQEMSNESESTH